MVVEIQCCVNSTNQHVQRPSPAPWKFRTFEKVLESSDFLRGKFLPGPELYLDPGSCGGNTPSAGPKSLPLQKISLFKCAISKLLYKLKLGKYTLGTFYVLLRNGLCVLLRNILKITFKYTWVILRKSLWLLTIWAILVLLESVFSLLVGGR